MKLLVLLVAFVVFTGLSQDKKTVAIDRAKVDKRLEQLRTDYQKLQGYLANPYTAIPEWTAQMKQIEGFVGGLSAAVSDTSLAVSDTIKVAQKAKK